MASERASEEIKSRLDILEVIGEQVRLGRAGREWRGLCPFHTEHTPSFYVNPEKQVFNCHGCHEGGDIFRFVELSEHTDFRGALELLARRAGVDLERERPATPQERRRRQQREALLRLNQLAEGFYRHVLRQSPAGEHGRQFLESRGVSAEEQERFRLGYAPLGTTADNLVRFLRRRGAELGDLADSGLARGRGERLQDFFRQRLVIPIRDEQGRCVGFAGRAVADASPKYLNSRTTALYDKSRLLFGLDLAREAVSRTRQAVLVEGYFDVIGAHRAGVENAVSTSGTALTEAQVRLLRRFAGEVVLCFDGDAAGRRAAEAAVDLVTRAGVECRLLTLPPGEDPDDLSRSRPEELGRLLKAAPPAWEELVDRALGDASPRSGGAEQAALRRALLVLRRIPEASIRALYAGRVGRRLGVDSERILRDVEGTGRSRSGSEETAGLEPTLGGQAAMGNSAHLLGMLWHSPQLVTELQDRFQMRREDFPDPQMGELFQAMVEAAPQRLNPESLAPELGAQLRQLPRSGFPELEADATAERRVQSLGDHVRQIRIETLENRESSLKRALVGLGHHREGEAPQLVAELERTQRRILALRRGDGMEA